MTHNTTFDSFYDITELVTTIDAAKNIDEALAVTGRIKPKNGIFPSSYSARMDYIIAKRGKRAVSGFFDPTKAKVTQKFIAVWMEEHGSNTAVPLEVQNPGEETEDQVYSMEVSHMSMQDDFTYTGTLTELVEQIEADVFSYERSAGPELMVKFNAEADEAEELGIELGECFWILFDESRHLEKPEITTDLVEQYAQHIYDGQIYMRAK